jgi:hypothetical protein
MAASTVLLLIEAVVDDPPAVRSTHLMLGKRQQRH